MAQSTVKCICINCSRVTESYDVHLHVSGVMQPGHMIKLLRCRYTPLLGPRSLLA